MMIWNSIDELLPGDSRPVLLSFQGYNTPMIGYCVCDENGTTFYTYDGVPALIMIYMLMPGWNCQPDITKVILTLARMRNLCSSMHMCGFMILQRIQR